MTNPENTPNTLSRHERLRRRGDVSSLFEEGQSGFVYPLKYVYRKVERVGDDREVTLLFTVPKRMHKRANKRNLLRRRIKEAYRLQKSTLSDGGAALNIAIIYSTKEVMEYDKIFRAVGKILLQIEQRVNTTVEV